MCANLLLFFELTLISQPKSRGHRETALQNRAFRVQTPTFAGRRLLRPRQGTMVFNRSAFMHSRYSVPKNYIFAQKIRTSGKKQGLLRQIKGRNSSPKRRRMEKSRKALQQTPSLLQRLPAFFRTTSVFLRDKFKEK